MYQYEILFAEGILSRDLYGMLCKEKRDGKWVAVSVSLPFSDKREEAERLAELCTAQQLPPEQVMKTVESIRKVVLK